ncbi:hypothetical protein [Mucispirillum schaedleri]|uniref:hypothetical protein n=1 Tax=Mucispirillum schaedleri TaxID=248039 RepID=UPI001F585436|nr:hypothetical protein [Mucispirillum schaedleri]
MTNNDIFNLIRNAVDMHDNKDCLERFKSLCRQFIKELEQTEEKGNTSNADFLKCHIGDIKEQVLEPLEDLSNIPLNNVKYLKITRDNIEQLKQLDEKLQAGAVLLFDYDKIVSYMPYIYFKRMIEGFYINAYEVDTDTFLKSDMYVKVRKELRA